MIRNSDLLFIQKFKYFCHTEENVQLKIYKFENIHSFLIISNLEQLTLIIKVISFELRRNKYLTFILMFFPPYLFLVSFKKFKSVIYFIGNINKNQLNMLNMYMNEKQSQKIHSSVIFIQFLISFLTLHC